MRRGVALAAALATGLLPVCAFAGSWTYGGELGAGYDGNAGNAGHDRDVRSAASAFAGASATWEQRFGLYTALQLRGSLAGEQVSNLEELSNTRATAKVRVLHKPGKGFHVPVLVASLSAGVRDYGSAIRDGTDYRASVSMTSPLTTLVQLRAEVARSRRQADGRVFDLDVTSYSLGADWAAAPRLTVYASARIDQGDFAVTALGEGVITPKTEHLYLQPRAAAIEPDDAFGGDWWAFRVNGRTLVGTAGFNIPLGADLALDFQVQGGEAHMDRFTYQRWLGSASLLARW